jgi:hypothetical protein
VNESKYRKNPQNSSHFFGATMPSWVIK